MYVSKHSAPPRHVKKRDSVHHSRMKRTGRKHNNPFLLIAVIALILGVTAGGTMAYLTSTTVSVENTFKPSYVDCQVNEIISGTMKTSVTVENLGGTGYTNYAYIRAVVTANNLKTENGITYIDASSANADITDCLNLVSSQFAAGWYAHTDGYYYYTVPVAPGASTGNLLNSTGIDFSDKQVIVAAEAIQAKPYSDTDGATAVGAWAYYASN